MTPQTLEISGTSTMQEVLDAFPSARRALFQRYHIGGCSSCGFSPEDTLTEVLSNHNVMDVEGTLDYIRESQKVDDQMQITAVELRDALKSATPPRLIDVRDQWEYEIAHLDGAELLTRPLISDMMDSWDKSTPLVFACHHGTRSLDAAAYFAGHGFKNVRSLQGGIDAWASEIDPQMARY